MFQFPGFAFLTLCIQVKNTWFTLLLITLAGNNNRISGGLPHSEIAGSKPILGSPTLIAEYHVLHRLLLPRHPPNALFALDLIQKKTDVSHKTPFVRPYACFLLGTGHIFRNKSHTFSRSDTGTYRNIWLVYLTWTTSSFQPADTPAFGNE